MDRSGRSRWGSLIGNAVDRGGGRTPMRDHFDCALRHGSCVRQWRPGAHRHGRAAEFENMATIQVRLRPVPRRAIFAIEFRRRHEDGLLALPEPRRIFPALCSVPRHDDLFALVEIFAKLMILSTVQATTTVVSPLAFARPGSELAALRANGSTKDLEDYRREK